MREKLLLCNRLLSHEANYCLTRRHGVVAVSANCRKADRYETDRILFEIADETLFLRRL
jgi:hypothetical protein